MAREEDLTNRIRVALAHVPNVAEKRMFGSTAFVVHGKLCVSGRAERMMCRIDPALHDAAVEREDCRTVVMKGRPCRGYVYVDADAVKTQDALRYWIDLALQHNASFE
jgi:TfoX/Sxy family transcriptional regulator of competence genes